MTRDVPGRSWERAASPGELGWSAERLAAARAHAATIDSDAVSIVVAGRIVAELGDVATRLNVHSIRKAFVSALIGIHVHEGRLRLSDTLADLGIDDNAPALSARRGRACSRISEPASRSRSGWRTSGSRTAPTWIRSTRPTRSG